MKLKSRVIVASIMEYVESDFRQISHLMMPMMFRQLDSDSSIDHSGSNLIISQHWSPLEELLIK